MLGLKTDFSTFLTPLNWTSVLPIHQKGPAELDINASNPFEKVPTIGLQCLQSIWKGLYYWIMNHFGNLGSWKYWKPPILVTWGLGNITLLWMSELILWVSELILWVSELIIWVSDITFVFILQVGNNLKRIHNSPSSMPISGGPTAYYWTSMSIFNFRNSQRGAGAGVVAAASRELWPFGGTPVHRAQEPNIPFGESLTSTYV